MKQTKAISLAITGFAAVALTNTQALANSSDAEIANTSDKEITLGNSVFASNCEQPANRDYHSILSAFEGDTDGQYKFSGCGTAI